MTKWNQIKSRIKAIDELRVFALPVRPIEAALAVRSERATVVVGKDGRIYSSEVSTTTFWTTTHRLERTIAGLIKLKLLTPEALAQHKEAAAADEAVRSRRWASDNVLENAERAGIKLTAAQARKLTAQSSAALHGGDDY